LDADDGKGADGNSSESSGKFIQLT